MQPNMKSKHTHTHAPTYTHTHTHTKPPNPPQLFVLLYWPSGTAACLHTSVQANIAHRCHRVFGAGIAETPVSRVCKKPSNAAVCLWSEKVLHALQG